MFRKKQPRPPEKKVRQLKTAQERKQTLGKFVQGLRIDI
jgi:hypothetical protein